MATPTVTSAASDAVMALTRAGLRHPPSTAERVKRTPG
jgi:hypothetical protein